MNSKSKERWGLAVVVMLVLGATAIIAWNRRTANTENAPDGVFFICANENCKHEFNLTMMQYSDYTAKHYGEQMECPKCGQKRTIKAIRCWSCKKYYPMPREVMPCPSCGKLPKRDEE